MFVFVLSWIEADLPDGRIFFFFFWRASGKTPPLRMLCLLTGLTILFSAKCENNSQLYQSQRQNTIIHDVCAALTAQETWALLHQVRTFVFAFSVIAAAHLCFCFFLFFLHRHQLKPHFNGSHMVWNGRRWSAKGCLLHSVVSRCTNNGLDDALPTSHAAVLHGRRDNLLLKNHSSSHTTTSLETTNCKQMAKTGEGAQL